MNKELSNSKANILNVDYLENKQLYPGFHKQGCNSYRNHTCCMNEFTKGIASIYYQPYKNRWSFCYGELKSMKSNDYDSFKWLQCISDKRIPVEKTNSYLIGISRTYEPDENYKIIEEVQLSDPGPQERISDIRLAATFSSVYQISDSQKLII